MLSGGNSFFHNVRHPDEIISPLRKKFSGGKKGVWGPLGVIIFIVVIWGISSSFYTVDTNEVGLVLRFGKLVRKTQPGLHFKLPWGIDRVYLKKVDYNYKEEFGFRTYKAGVRSVYSRRGYDDESIMLTGDLNVLDIEWIIQYKIKDPYKVLFRIRNYEKTLRDLSESVMREVVGDYSFNEVLTSKRLEINNKVQEKLQKIIDDYDIGINIVTVKLQNVNPPDPVKPAFNDVNAAKQEREKMINQAWEAYNRKIPEAKGKARKIIEEAQGYAQEKVNRAQGDAKRFLLLWREYINAKDITKKRLYLEYMEDILNKAGRKYIIDPKEQSILPLLKLENE